MYLVPGGETIPFHLVWIGLSVVYGFIRMRPWAMVVVLSLVAVTTGAILAHHAQAGVIRWEETTEVPLMSVVFVVMVWHVHRRQRAMAELARLAAAERRRAETQQLFIQLASHELRTPITVARGYTELVRRRSENDATNEDTEIVLQELDKLTHITQRLVTLMQMEHPYAREPADVDAELARIVHRWEPAASRQWTVRSTIGRTPINQERLATAMDSLLENAVKFTGVGDRIEVSGYTTHEHWIIEVCDSGSGLTSEQAAALNAANGPLRHTLSGSGTGLGLAIARAVAVSWGGELHIAGEPGRGTTVTLRFPRRLTDQTPVSPMARMLSSAR
jgi:two-component system, OmpR family, sensor kinase